MDDNVKYACADMVFADGIETLANREGISVDESRSRLIDSGAYAALYDLETELWKEGPDYFLSFMGTWRGCGPDAMRIPNKTWMPFHRAIRLLRMHIARPRTPAPWRVRPWQSHDWSGGFCPARTPFTPGPAPRLRRS